MKTTNTRLTIRQAKSNESIQQLFNKPAQVTEWITAEDIKEVKDAIHATPAAMLALETKANDVVKYATEYFLYTLEDSFIANILNKMHAMEEHLQVEVGKLTLKLRVQPNHAFSTFHQEEMKSIIAFTIITGLIETGKIQSQTTPVAETDEETGKKTWRNQTFVTFGYEKGTNPLYVHGISLEPTILQKKTKVRVGGKSVKLNSAEKKFLIEAGSTPLRIIDIDSQILVDYAKSSEWYENVINGTVNMDEIIANNLIKTQIEKFKLVQQLGSFYLPMWIDYRTRLYYELSQMLFNPHGKTFETSLFELAEPKMITDEGLDNLAYSAVVIIEGRMAHHLAMDKFYAEPRLYLDALREERTTTNKNGTVVKDFGKNLYNSRLADAIEDCYNGIPSHFLLGEDATNGGLQHGGIGFKSTKMMTSANVGGSSHQEDSHGDLQKALGLDTRDEAKPINTQLLHGQSISVTAKSMGKTVTETKAMLAEAYGNEFFNIEVIADWGTRVIDNSNTTLMWETSDGFKAQSIAYTQSVPLTLYALSSTNKAGYSQTKVHRDMPMLLDAKGNPIYGNIGDNITMGAAAKLRGLYANITHSIDGTSLRYVIRALKADDVTNGGVYKHDNFLVHPNDMSVVRHGYKDGLLDEFDGDLYASAMDQIISNFKGSVPLRPTLVYGTATKDMIVNSHYYLAP